MSWDRTPSSSEGASDALVIAARNGDLAAFNALVLLHQRQVYNVCLRMLGHRDDAADAAQEAFLHAYRSISTYAGGAAGFRSWLLRIAVNACYDMLRRRKRRPSESLDALLAADDAGNGPLEVAVVDTSASGPEEQALGNETTRQVQAGLLQLNADQRVVVVLCDVQGFSYEEAASAIGTELGTVKSRLSRARAQLRAFLSGKGELPAASRRLESEGPRISDAD